MLQGVLSTERPGACRPSQRTRLALKVAQLLTLTLAFGFASVVRAQSGASPAAAPVPADDAEAQIRAVLAAQTKAWNRGDVRAFMQGYWNSPDTEFVGSNGIVRGWQPVLDRYRKSYPDRAAMGHLDFSKLELTMLGPEAALVVGHFHLKRQNDEPTGVFTLIFRKFPEGWRIVHDHTSQTVTPAHP